MTTSLYFCPRPWSPGWKPAFCRFGWHRRSWSRKKIRVLGLSLGIDGPPPGVDKVLGRHRIPVGPLVVLSQGKGVSFTVFGNFFRGCQAGSDLWVLAQSVQAFKGVGDLGKGNWVGRFWQIHGRNFSTSWPVQSFLADELAFEEPHAVNASAARQTQAVLDLSFSEFSLSCPLLSHLCNR